MLAHCHATDCRCDCSASTSDHPNKSSCVLTNKCRACSGSRFRELHKPEHCKAHHFVTLSIKIYFKHTHANNTNNTSIQKYTADTHFARSYSSLWHLRSCCSGYATH